MKGRRGGVASVGHVNDRVMLSAFLCSHLPSHVSCRDVLRVALSPRPLGGLSTRSSVRMAPKREASPAPPPWMSATHARTRDPTQGDRQALRGEKRWQEAKTSAEEDVKRGRMPTFSATSASGASGSAEAMPPSTPPLGSAAELQRVLTNYARDTLSMKPGGLDPFAYTKIIRGRPVQASSGNSFHLLWKVWECMYEKGSVIQFVFFLCVSWHSRPSPAPALSVCCWSFTNWMKKRVHLMGEKEALVVTHEEASEIATEPYFSCRFRPLQAIELVGRSARKQPTCPLRHSVFYWWKDRSGVETKCHVWVSSARCR